MQAQEPADHAADRSKRQAGRAAAAVRRRGRRADPEGQGLLLPRLRPAGRATSRCSPIRSAANFYTNGCTAPAANCASATSFFQSLQVLNPRSGNNKVGLGKVDVAINQANTLSLSVNSHRWDSPERRADAAGGLGRAVAERQRHRQDRLLRRQPQHHPQPALAERVPRSRSAATTRSRRRTAFRRARRSPAGSTSACRTSCRVPPIRTSSAFSSSTR